MTDNASNMKHAFETAVESNDEDEEDEAEMDTLQQWTVNPLKVGLVVLPIKYSWLSMMGIMS